MVNYFVKRLLLFFPCEAEVSGTDNEAPNGQVKIRTNENCKPIQKEMADIPWHDSQYCRNNKISKKRALVFVPDVRKWAQRNPLSYYGKEYSAAKCNTPGEFRKAGITNITALNLSVIG